MNTLSNWLHRILGRSSTSASTTTADPQNDLQSRARALVASGDADGASELYWKIKRKDLTPEALVEHAEVLLGKGDLFGAASRAARALERDPHCAGARAVQDKVRLIESAERSRPPSHNPGW